MHELEYGHRKNELLLSMFDVGCSGESFICTGCWGSPVLGPFKFANQLYTRVIGYTSNNIYPTPTIGASHFFDDVLRAIM